MQPLLAPGETSAGGLPAEEVESWLAVVRSLPKVELHAHINGCVRDETLIQLAEEFGGDELAGKDFLRKTGPRTLSDCFAQFDVIHRLTTRHDAVARITREVIDDFAEDGVVYCELRTTPKNNPAVGMTKRSYIESVLRGVDAASCGPAGGSGGGRITVRLLLSIDRRETAEAALETVLLAEEFRSRGVVGVDLSGNPTLGDFDTWRPALQRARDSGLALTLHCAEVDDPAEVRAMLAFRPERLGHAVTAAMSDELRAELLSSRIPVELCLTSNVLSQSTPSYGEHHFGDLAAAGHPVALCTDDSGVFLTTLSRECAIAAVAFGLSREQLWDLSAGALKMAFVEPAVRSAVAEAHFGAAARAAFLASGTSENANGTRAGASAAPATAAEARSGAEASQDAPPAAVPSGGGFAKIITAVAEPRENGHANGHGNGHFCIDIEGGGAWGEEDADWDCEGGGAAASNGGDKPGENGHDASSPERPTANGGGAHASASAFAPPTPYPQQKQQQQPKPEAEDEDDGWGAASDAPPKPKPSLEDGGGRTRRPPSACPSASADLRPRSSRRGGALPARRVSWSETVVDPVRAPPRPPPRDLHVYALEAGLAHTVRMAEQKRTDIEQLEAAIEMTRSDIRAAVEAEPPTGGPRAEELYEELQERRESLSYAKEDLAELEQQQASKEQQLAKALAERKAAEAGEPPL